MKGSRVIPQSVISVQSCGSAHGQGCWVLVGNNRSQPGWDGQQLFSSFHNNQKYRKRPGEENSAPYYLATLDGNHFAGMRSPNGRRKHDLPSSRQALVRRLAFLCRGLSTLPRLRDDPKN